MDEENRLKKLRELEKFLHYPEAYPLEKIDIEFKEYLRSVYIPLKQDLPDYDLITYIQHIVGIYENMLRNPHSNFSIKFLDNNFFLPAMKEFQVYITIQSRKFHTSYSILERFLEYGKNTYLDNRIISKGILTRTLKNYRPEFEKAIEKFSDYFTNAIRKEDAPQKNIFPDLLKHENPKCYKAFRNAIALGEIVLEDDDFYNFKNLPQTSINHFFKHGKYTEWQTIRKYVKARGANLTESFKNAGTSNISKNGQKFISLMYKEIDPS